jgi:GTP-binding protein
MQITRVEFLRSAVSAQQYPSAERPEIAFLGRSNVGKSSLINVLVARSKLVKTSATPGKTQQLNFFLVNEKLVFVDLPGYGYAKVPASIRRRWKPMVETYLQQREVLVGVVHVLDVRHHPTREDLQMQEWLRYYQLPAITVATKADKISRGRHQQQAHFLKATLGVPDDFPLILFSAKSKEGREAIWEQIMQWTRTVDCLE